jgi:phosphoribosylformylglycinamidine synthase
LNTPVVSGNASLYNETPNGQILPTPSIGMLGVIEQVETVLRIAPNSGDMLLLVGAEPVQAAGTLAGSEYLTAKLGRLAGRPIIDLDHEARVQELVLDAHDAGLLTAAHDCADGGLAVTLAEMCLAGGAGIDASVIELGPRLDASLFGEAQSRFIVAVADDSAASDLAARATAIDVPITQLGKMEGLRLRLGPTDLAVDDLRAAYDNGLERALRD